jgi:hypothetical protein
MIIKPHIVGQNAEIREFLDYLKILKFSWLSSSKVDVVGIELTFEFLLILYSFEFSSLPHLKHLIFQYFILY